MNRTSQKALEGENGVRDFLRLWYPQEDPNLVLPVRTKSQGMNDVGDIGSIPYVCIEVKNHTNPIIGTLLENAKWKAINSRKTIWFLAYKRKGFSAARAGYWHTCTTVEALLNGYRPITTNSRQEIQHKDIESLCHQQMDILAEPGWYPSGATLPKFRWKLLLMFRPYMTNIDEKRNQDFDQVGLSTDDMVVPMIISPRRQKEVKDWYSYTRLAGQARLLETCGVLLQDQDDYLQEQK